MKQCCKNMEEYPFKFEELETETEKHLMSMYKGHRSGFMRVQPGGLLVPRPYTRDLERIYRMEVRPDDVFVLSWPKTGTAWTQEMVWTIHHDGDTQASRAKDMWEKWYFLEFDSILSQTVNAEEEKSISEEDRISKSLLQKAVDSPSPRFIKSHLPISMLPPKLMDTCKVFYVTRNPMDACVSWYHHATMWKNHDWQGTFTEFMYCFIEENIVYSPYWSNVLEAWHLRHHPNMCFLFYEDLKKDLSSGIKKAAKFLGKSFTTDQMQELCSHLSFASMKNNPTTNMASMKEKGATKQGQESNHMRKGVVGDWINYFTPQMKRDMDAWSRANTSGCDITFPGVDCGIAPSGVSTNKQHK